MVSVNTCCLQLLNSICVAEKATKGTELQILCTQGTLQGGRVEDHRMMFTRHLHLPQSHIQAKLYIYVEQPTVPIIYLNHRYLGLSVKFCMSPKTYNTTSYYPTALSKLQITRE